MLWLPSEERKLSSSFRVRIWLLCRANFSFTSQEIPFSMVSCLYSSCWPCIRTCYDMCCQIHTVHGFPVISDQKNTLGFDADPAMFLLSQIPFPQSPLVHLSLEGRWQCIQLLIKRLGMETLLLNGPSIHPTESNFLFPIPIHSPIIGRKTAVHPIAESYNEVFGKQPHQEKGVWPWRNLTLGSSSKAC